MSELKYMCKIGESTPVLYDKAMFHPEVYEMWEPEAKPKAKSHKKVVKKDEAEGAADDLAELDALLANPGPGPALDDEEDDDEFLAAVPGAGKA